MLDLLLLLLKIVAPIVLVEFLAQLDSLWRHRPAPNYPQFSYVVPVSTYTKKYYKALNRVC